MQTLRRTIGDGPEHVAEILGTLTALKEYYGTVPAIRRAALALAAGPINNDTAGHAARLAAFVRRAVVYVADPINTEFIQTPDVMLTAINDTGHTTGDCDDHVLLFASLAESLGIATDIAGVCAPGTDQINHVIAIAQLPSGPMQIDLCAKNGFQPFYSPTLVVPSP